MELARLISEVPFWQTLTPSQLVSELNADSIEVVDPQLYTWAGVALIAGAAGAEGLRLGLEGNGLGWVVHQLGGSGIQLSNPLVQQVLIVLGQAGVPGCLALATTGIHYVSPAQNAGLPPATLSKVESAIALLTLQATKQQMRQDGASRYNVYIDAIDEYDGSGDLPVL